MLKTFIAKLALRAVVVDDPFIRVSLHQSKDQEKWLVSLSLLGSSRPWQVRLHFDPGLIESAGISIPAELTYSNERYVLPQFLTANEPLSLSLQAKALGRSFGYVWFEFEAKARIGGTILPMWVPLGYGNEQRLKAFTDSHAKLFSQWQEAHAG